MYTEYNYIVNVKLHLSIEKPNKILYIMKLYLSINFIF